MLNQHDVIPWSQPGWFEQVNQWVQTELAGRNIVIHGKLEQSHAYPWSTVLRVPTSEGTLYFKAVSPLAPHEPPLLQVLTAWRPERVPSLLSIDLARGWLLMRDAGPMLRDAIRPTEDIRPWFPVLPMYAELQIEMAERVPELLALGVPDRRLTVLPALYDALLADTDAMGINQSPGLTSEQYQQLLAFSPRVAHLCEQLARYPVRETLNHGDLTDGNILQGGGQPVFIDWGDSCVSHPFFSLRTVLVSAEISLNLEENAPELQPLRDAYLEPWTRYASRRDLLAVLDITSRLASINGALTWHNLVSKLTGQVRATYAHTVPALLQEFLDAEIVASAKPDE